MASCILPRPRIFAVALSVLLCLTLRAHAASSLPEAPKPHAVFSKIDWALSAGVFAAHAGDYLSTEQGMREPNRFRESNLSQSLAYSHVGLATYEFATAGLEVFGAYELCKLGHPRIGRIVQAVNIGYTSKVVARNYQIDWKTR